MPDGPGSFVGPGVFQAQQPNPLLQLASSFIGAQQQARQQAIQQQLQQAQLQRAAIENQFLPQQMQQQLAIGQAQTNVAQRQSKEFYTVPPAFQKLPGLSDEEKSRTFSTQTELDKWMDDHTPAEIKIKGDDILATAATGGPTGRAAALEKVNALSSDDKDTVTAYMASKQSNYLLGQTVGYDKATLSANAKTYAADLSNQTKLIMQQRGFNFKSEEADKTRALRWQMFMGTYDLNAYYKSAYLAYLKDTLDEKKAQAAAKFETEQAKLIMEKNKNNIALYKDSLSGPSPLQPPTLQDSGMPSYAPGQSTPLPAPPSAPTSPLQPSSGSQLEQVGSKILASPGATGIKVKAYTVAQENGIDPNLMLMVIGGESGFNPSAIGDKTDPGGPSFGLGQIHLSDHPDFDVKKAQDPKTGIDYQLKYVAGLLKGKTPEQAADTFHALRNQYNIGSKGSDKSAVSSAPKAKPKAKISEDDKTNKTIAAMDNTKSLSELESIESAVSASTLIPQGAKDKIKKHVAFLKRTRFNAPSKTAPFDFVINPGMKAANFLMGLPSGEPSQRAER